MEFNRDSLARSTPTNCCSARKTCAIDSYWELGPKIIIANYQLKSQILFQMWFEDQDKIIKKTKIVLDERIQTVTRSFILNILFSNCKLFFSRRIFTILHLRCCIAYIVSPLPPQWTLVGLSPFSRQAKRFHKSLWVMQNVPIFRLFWIWIG